MNYREKIKKLLALATSDNENEATAALLKAKVLMAEHKLTELDVADVGDKRAVRLKTGIKFTRYSENWVYSLARVIAENYCCKELRARQYGKQVGEIMLVGLEEDADICCTVLKYAVDCVRSYCEKRKKALKRDGYGSDYIRSQLCSYGEGFVEGVRIAYDRQKEQNEAEWGLVLVMPHEVIQECERIGIRQSHYNSSAARSASAYSAGRDDGERFNPNARVEAKRAALPA